MRKITDGSLRILISSWKKAYGFVASEEFLGEVLCIATIYCVAEKHVAMRLSIHSSRRLAIRSAFSPGETSPEEKCAHRQHRNRRQDSEFPQRSSQIYLQWGTDQLGTCSWRSRCPVCSTCTGKALHSCRTAILQASSGGVIPSLVLLKLIFLGEARQKLQVHCLQRPFHPLMTILVLSLRFIVRRDTDTMVCPQNSQVSVPVDVSVGFPHVGQKANRAKRGWLAVPSASAFCRGRRCLCLAIACPAALSRRQVRYALRSKQSTATNVINSQSGISSFANTFMYYVLSMYSTSGLSAKRLPLASSSSLYSFPET